MSNPDDQLQEEGREDELELEPETVRDLDVAEAGAEQVVGGAASLLTRST